jgi:hypothetical protein
VFVSEAMREGAMHKIVEAVVRNGDQRVPIGLMTVKQALEMAERANFEFSHPEYVAGRTDIFVSRDVLAKMG